MNLEQRDELELCRQLDSSQFPSGLRALVGAQPLESVLHQGVQWVDDLVEQYQPNARTVASFGFENLERYYPSEVLERAQVVVLPEVPEFPFVEFGVVPVAGFADQLAAGITFKNMYFVRADQADRESLHFHELVHTVQYESLGAARFLIYYGEFLTRFGYRQNPLETPAYDLQERFESGGTQNHSSVFNPVQETLARIERIEADYPL